MNSRQGTISRVHVWRTLAWWAVGSALLLAALWAGPRAWAAGLGSCGESTIPGVCAVDDGAGTEYGMAVVIPVLANDLDRAHTGLTVTVVTTPEHGTAVRNIDNTVTYTPADGFSGGDEFQYTVRDGLDIEAAAKVIVMVAAQEQQQPIVRPVDPLTDTTNAFTNTVRMPDGSRVAVTTTVEVPSGAFSVTLGPTDTLAIVFQPVVTPTGNVNMPPMVLLAGQAAGQVTPQAAEQARSVNFNYRWSKISFWLDSLLNGRSLGRVGLLKPMTFVVGYDPVLVANLNENTMAPYYWTGSAWSKEGVTVTDRNANANRITFTVDRIVGELSFFARPNLLYLPALHTVTN
jgi:hypothetical protein